MGKAQVSRVKINKRLMIMQRAANEIASLLGQAEEDDSLSLRDWEHIKDRIKDTITYIRDEIIWW